MALYLTPGKYTERNKDGEAIRFFRGSVNVGGNTVADLVELEKEIAEYLKGMFSATNLECTFVADTDYDGDAYTKLEYEAYRPATASETRELVMHENSAKDKERRRLEAEFNRLKKLLGKE